MRIVTLLARHGKQRYADAVEEMQTLFATQFSHVEHELLVVDNSLPEEYVGCIRGSAVIGSSNEHWEFSAWDRGIRYLGGRIETFDLVHLATSAFGALDRRHLDGFEEHALDSLAGRAVAVGPIDYYPMPVVVHNRASQ